MLDLLALPPGIPHAATATALSTTALAVLSSAAATYTTTGTGGGAITPSSAALRCPRFVSVRNNDSAIVIFANVGTSAGVPPAATAGCEPIGPGEKRFFLVPGNSVAGLFGALSLLAASGTPTCVICWHY